MVRRGPPVASAAAEVRFARSQIRQVYATGHYSHDQYTARMLEVAADFYQRIPERWLREGVNVYLRYDFAASTDASIPAELRHMGFTQPTAIDSDSPAAQPQEEQIEEQSHPRGAGELRATDEVEITGERKNMRWTRELDTVLLRQILSTGVDAFMTSRHNTKNKKYDQSKTWQGPGGIIPTLQEMATGAPQYHTAIRL
ncbi:hypothetical protein AB1Y20_021382 [Prymnesium parvum]|uniref:Uncharacterized protein n=1 Tax=Prymnesium parvum TaxID=97485 RepID=A0AB34JKG0_PRYPA